MKDMNLPSMGAAATASDSDPLETAEWRDAFLSLVAANGPERSRFILDKLMQLANTSQLNWQPELATPYVNSVAVEREPAYPGDLVMEERLGSLIRWNALQNTTR